VAMDLGYDNPAEFTSISSEPGVSPQRLSQAKSAVTDVCGWQLEPLAPRVRTTSLGGEFIENSCLFRRYARPSSTAMAKGAVVIAVLLTQYDRVMAPARRGDDPAVAQVLERGLRGTKRRSMIGTGRTLPARASAHHLFGFGQRAVMVPSIVIARQRKHRDRRRIGTADQPVTTTLPPFASAPRRKGQRSDRCRQNRPRRNTPRSPSAAPCAPPDRLDRRRPRRRP